MPKTPFEEFFDSYLATALWAESCEQEPHPDRSMSDAGYDRDDIDQGSLAKMRAECEAWFTANAAHIGEETERAGHDFWLTRNHHSAGFWDGDWAEPAATILDNASKAAGERNLYVGDDGRVYCYQL
jgi:hypothetical protein